MMCNLRSSPPNIDPRLQGPTRVWCLRKLTPFNLETIRYYRFVETQVVGVDCIVARMGYTGEFGYELHFHPRHAEKIWTALMSTGADVDMVPCGQAALESLRQEAGYLLVGNDHDRSTNPFEAGIGFTVKLGTQTLTASKPFNKLLGKTGSRDRWCGSIWPRELNRRRAIQFSSAEKNRTSDEWFVFAEPSAWHGNGLRHPRACNLRDRRNNRKSGYPSRCYCQRDATIRSWQLAHSIAFSITSG